MPLADWTDLDTAKIQDLFTSVIPELMKEDHIRLGVDKLKADFMKKRQAPQEIVKTNI
jgi:hypothetical protein